MGRTVPSFRMLLEGIIEDMLVFRRALRGEDIAAFDRLMNKARQHASSCTITPMLEPMDAFPKNTHHLAGCIRPSRVDGYPKGHKKLFIHYGGNNHLPYEIDYVNGTRTICRIAMA